MKQLTITEVLAAFVDEPTAIGDRLEILGVSKKDLEGKFSKDVLGTKIYASSFVKFLHDNASKINDKIPAKDLPEGYKNPFDSGTDSVRNRLDALGLEKTDYEDLFDKNTLDLALTGVEFHDFIVNNEAKFLGKLRQVAAQGG